MEKLENILIEAEMIAQLLIFFWHILKIELTNKLSRPFEKFCDFPMWARTTNKLMRTANIPSEKKSRHSSKS